MLKNERDLVEAIRYDYLTTNIVFELLNQYFSLSKTARRQLFILCFDTDNAKS